ncbi:Nucleic-acid-binding protein from transposon X-element [Eumeta japonica]|uniref:Nucleic-acid-binding protein from transposon X-element n=1 Tax=Eumeta variegata TaxID=151549 RepID=A0A4C1XM71_EUMVA|nr:Nucleic-acid-binding protein from transposon X-element [Eumeta japonica]
MTAISLTLPLDLRLTRENPEKKSRTVPLLMCRPQWRRDVVTYTHHRHPPWSRRQRTVLFEHRHTPIVIIGAICRIHVELHDAAARRDHQVTRYCYALETEKPSKVGIRGLPVDTAPDIIVSELQELDFPAKYVRPIPPQKGRPGCLFYVRLGHMDQDRFQKLYELNTLLNMPGITIEGWRGREGLPQCHRCQAFGHSSVNCHRPQRCVRCGEGHIAADCTKPRDQGPTRANCQVPHPASDRRCPVFLREARQRGNIIPPPYGLRKFPLQNIDSSVKAE